MTRSRAANARRRIKVRTQDGQTFWTETIADALKRAKDNMFVKDISWWDPKTSEAIVLKRSSVPDQWIFKLK